MKSKAKGKSYRVLLGLIVVGCWPKVSIWLKLSTKIRYGLVMLESAVDTKVF